MAVDQIIKLIVVQTLDQYESIVLIPKVLRVTLIYNDGAAFGIFGGRSVFLIIFTVVILLLLFGLILKNKLQNCYLIPIGIICAGGLGNLIDRIIRGEVIDYIDLEFWPFNHFAIFNLSDCMVVFGVIALVLAIITNEFISDKKDKKEKGAGVQNINDKNIRDESLRGEPEGEDKR